MVLFKNAEGFSVKYLISSLDSICDNIISSIQKYTANDKHWKYTKNGKSKSR